MNPPYNSAVHWPRSDVPKHIMAGVAAFVMLWMSCGSDCVSAGSADLSQVVLHDGVRAVRIEGDANAISLGEAAFFHPFQRHLISARGTHRRHAALSAVLIPRSANGDLDHSSAIEATIDRSAVKDTIVFSGLGTLTLSPDGTLEGQLRSGDRDVWYTGVSLMLTAMVFDQVLGTVPDKRLIDEYQLPIVRLDPDTQASDAEKMTPGRFFFYKEWKPDWNDLPKPEDIQGVSAHFAVRREFSLFLSSRYQEYDPKRSPLGAYCPERHEAAETTPTVVAVSITGGIEPYEVRTSILPPGLKWDSDRMVLSGIPERAGSYSVAIEIKDAQFPSGQWEQARNAARTLGTPWHRLTTTFYIRKPIEVELVLPPYSRKGDQVSAVCLYKGGPNRAVFEAVKLPPGIQVDRESGRIYGVPIQAGEYPVQVRVTSPATAEDEAVQRATAEGTWKIIEPLPAPALR